jgi:hypothetical protein
MTSLAQLLLIIVISTLTFLIALVAIQVLHLLHDARQTINKFNQWMDSDQQDTSIQTTPNTSSNGVITQIKKINSSRRFFRKSRTTVR